MQITEMEYDRYLDGHFPFLMEVRAFGECKVLAAGREDYLLILDDPQHRRVVVFDYDTPEERQKGIEVVRRIPDGDGGEGSAIFARLSPTPPSRSARDAKPFPDDVDEDPADR